MAVEAHNLNMFSPQFIGNRMVMNAVEANGRGMHNNNGAIGYGSVPISGTTTAETLYPMYNNSVIVDSTNSLLKNTAAPCALRDDSGLTYNFPAVSVSRKRSRDLAGLNPVITGYNKDFHRCSNSGSISFLGEDVSSHLVLQQLDVDRLISQHMQKVRMEIEESQKRHSRRVIEAVEVGIMKQLKAKDEEIEKIGKVNWALEERVKSLYMENQIWRDLAQSNEATANVLRNNLEIVLSQVNDVRTTASEGLDNVNNLNDDAESCCGSNNFCGYDDECNNKLENNGWRSVAADADERKSVKDKESGNMLRMCRKCGKKEACVLLLPCRHLCLCTSCGSSLHTCPICKSNQTASVRVNIS